MASCTVLVLLHCRRDARLNLSGRLNSPSRFHVIFTGMKKLFAAAVLFLAFALIPAMPSRQNDGRDIIDTIMTVDQFDTFLELVREADLTFTLKRAGPYTVFAPTNDAFKKLPEGRLQGLLSNKKALRRFLLSHVVYGRFAADQAVRQKSIKTLAGGTIKFENVQGHGLIGGTAHYAVTNVVTHNGLVQGIDTVLTPSLDTPDQP